jgi:hypothetical protein
MPTVNPRVQVTLSPSLDLLVCRLAVHQRVSKSQVLRELLEAAEPALQRAVALMDAASTATKQVKTGLASALTKAQDHAEIELERILGTLDGASDDLVSQAETVRGRRPARHGLPSASGASEGVLTPVPVTRGSGLRNTRRARQVKGVQSGSL